MARNIQEYIELFRIWFFGVATDSPAWEAPATTDS